MLKSNAVGPIIVLSNTFFFFTFQRSFEKPTSFLEGGRFPRGGAGDIRAAGGGGLPLGSSPLHPPGHHPDGLNGEGFDRELWA